MQLAHILAITAVFVVAGGVKGITGMGLPTVAVSLLGLWMAPAEAAALLVLPALATNVAQCRGPQLGRLVRLLWPAWLALAVVTLLAPGLGDAAAAGAGGFGDGPAAGWNGRRLLGGVLVLYGAWGLWRPALPVSPARPGRRSALIGLLVGGLTGLVTAATAVFVLPLVPWLQSLRLEKDTMVQALGLSFGVATLALALRLQVAGSGVAWSVPTLVALAAAFEGLWLGSLVRARLSGPGFQRALFGVFILLGVANAVQGG